MSKDASIITCQKCGEPLEADWKECPVCLTPTSSGVLTCPNCQAPIKKNWKICPRCETRLSGWETPPVQESSAAEQMSNSKNNQFFVSMVENEPAAIVGFGLELPITKGDVLGDRYRIIQPLGAGGFGAVYQVDDLVLNEQMALKIVVAGGGKAQRAAEQILHEFKLRERINDITYIIKAQDPRPCEYKGLSLVLLPMEFANGKSMRQWLVQNQDIEKRQKTGLVLFRQACLGVKAIHDAGLVHMDIKPDNILIVEGKAKIADFGIGRYGASQFANNPDQLLRQGIGTPQYMSPEQFHVARQKDVGPASDIYSLGVVLFELLDGNLPFDGTPIELMDKHLNTQPPHLTGKTEKWSRISDRCLAKNPGERYLDISQLIADLDRAAQGATLSVDVSCPKCDHINANPDSKVCGKCRADLASLFRSCPVCTRSIRLDIKTCPGCGQAVAAYYLLLDRRKQIEKLKDEDPVEAIEILEMVLRDGADDYQERAVELIRNLRQKQEKIGPLVAKANEASAIDVPEKAFEIWQQILHIIPRHKVAIKQVQKLEILIKSFNEQLKKAIDFMDKAEFESANKLLQDYLERTPTHKDIVKLLETCRVRAQKYRAAFEEALVSQKNRLLEKAKTQINIALIQAPNSKEALALNSELDKTAEKINALISQIKNHLVRAEFSESKKIIDDIHELQEDNKNLSSIKDETDKTEADYAKFLQEAKQAKFACNWSKAISKAKNALKLCPESCEATSLLEQVLVLEKQDAPKWEKPKKSKKRINIKIIAIGAVAIIVIVLVSLFLAMGSDPQPSNSSTVGKMQQVSLIKKGWVTSRGAGNEIPWADPPYKYTLVHETTSSNSRADLDHSGVLLYEKLSNGKERALNRRDGRFIRDKKGGGGWYIGMLSFDDTPLGTTQSVEVKNNDGRIYELRVMWTKLNRNNYGRLESAELYYEIHRK